MPLGADIQSVSGSVNKPDRQVSYVNAFTYHSYVRLLFTLIIVEIKICACQVSSLISTSGLFLLKKEILKHPPSKGPSSLPLIFL